MLLSEIITAAKGEGGLDVTDTQAQNWALQRIREMVAGSHWRMQEIAIGTTVADQAVYSLSEDIVDLEGILVGSLPYTRISTKGLWNLKTGWANWRGPGGLFAPSFETDASRAIELYPAPSTDGDSITGLAAMLPPDIATNQSPDVPTDLHPYIVDGVIATGLARMDEQAADADYFEQRFKGAVESLRRRRNSRVGSGPMQIVVS